MFDLHNNQPRDMFRKEPGRSGGLDVGNYPEPCDDLCFDYPPGELSHHLEKKIIIFESALWKEFISSLEGCAWTFFSIFLRVKSSYTWQTRKWELQSSGKTITKWPNDKHLLV